MSNDAMTAADAQVMIKEVLKAERVGGPVKEEASLDELTEDYKRPIFDAIGRLESDITDVKQAVSQGKLNEAALNVVSLVSHAGDVASYFVIVAKSQGFTGNPLRDIEGYLKRYKVKI
jgi:hypothetical protein